MHRFRFAVVVHPAASAGGTASLGISFDDAIERLSKLPGMFVEGDGSFVWTSAGVERDSDPKSRFETIPWQVDGQLTDGPAGLWYVSLRGDAPARAFDRLLEAISDRKSPLKFQILPGGELLDEGPFRTLAASGGS